MPTKPLACPRCGNTDKYTMQTNGERSRSPELAMLCLALVPARDSALDWAELDDRYEIDDLGRAPCYEQWYPNQEG